LSFLNILEHNKQEAIIEKQYKVLNFNDSIKLENLTFQYNSSLPKVLNNINIEILNE